jgi:hypothetical protein
MPHFGDYQNEIYVAGLSGRIPPLPIRFEELETKAHAVLSKSIVSYVAGGCGNERTQDANVKPSIAGGWCRECSSGPRNATCRSTCSE